MADTGVLVAGTASSVQYDNAGNVDWVNLSNCEGSNLGTYAYVELADSYSSGDTSFWILFNVSHSIPAGSTIDGIDARVYHEWHDDAGGGVATFQMQLRLNGSLVGTPKSLSSLATDTDGWSADVGGASDLWGASPVQTDTFGLGFAVPSQAKDDVYVHAFELTIYYTDAGSGIVGSGYGTVNADGTLSGVGLMEASGRGDVNSSGILSGVGERTFTGYGEVVAFDGIYGVGQQNANGHGAVSADDPFIGIGRVPDSGFGVITGSDSFVGVGKVPDSGFGTVSATGSFTGVGEVPGNGYGTVTAAGSLAGTGLTTTGSDSALRRRLISMGA